MTFYYGMHCYLPFTNAKDVQTSFSRYSHPSDLLSMASKPMEADPLLQRDGDKLPQGYGTAESTIDESYRRSTYDHYHVCKICLFSISCLRKSVI